ncbi:hypothetical protein FNV43_RR21269 [Rhamnella rubrinervis]|uniref:Uncharacterized protein n=1 Tax=Rhamnella rubrinervis TaxID=2594499 RepID=A0A8K0GRA2_9ROSA|nr:hypothetical protein FNV43_RR21269 [Rhamnella rubrinervis]
MVDSNSSWRRGWQMTNRAIAKTKAATIPNANTSTESEQQSSPSSILHLVTLALFYK